MYIPEKGDIFHLSFDPATGSEMKGGHYALDWKIRRATFKETVPDYVLDDVLARIGAVLFD